MAVKLEGTIKRFIGNSADEKPLDVPVGSSFLETDTGQIYRFSNGTWTISQTTDDQAQLLGAILIELVAIRERVEIATD